MSLENQCHLEVAETHIRFVLCRVVQRGDPLDHHTGTIAELRALIETLHAAAGWED